MIKHDTRERAIPFLRMDFVPAVSNAVTSEIAADVEGVIRRYEDRGIGDAGRMVEAYNTEYRALDHFCQQPLTLNADLDVAQPLGVPRLVEAILAVPITRRIHNSLSRALLRKFAPEVLEAPLAATAFVPAGAPILVQEMGRVARRVFDEMSKQTHRLTGGRVGIVRRFGWVDFEDLPSGDFLDTWRDSLSWEGFDQGAIARYIGALRNHERMVSLARPLLKLAYLDRMLRKKRLDRAGPR